MTRSVSAMITVIGPPGQGWEAEQNSLMVQATGEAMIRLREELGASLDRAAPGAKWTVSIKWNAMQITFSSVDGTP